MTEWNDPQGRPPYDQPTTQYGAVPGRPGAPAPNPFGTRGNEEFGIVGMVLGLLGGVLLVVCFTALDWFTFDTANGSSDVSFSDIDSDAIDGFAAAYFGWFAWTFAIIAVIAAVCSSFPSPALRAARVVGVVTAFAAAGLSFLAVQLTDGRGYADYLADARVGFYLAVVGFVLVGIGAGIGPRKV